MQRSAMVMKRQLLTPRCLRCFSASSPRDAGHNKWSKTKHIKAVTDRKKNTERTYFAKNITLYSKLYGDNLAFNPKLASVVAAATKASVPKTVIENAIAKGQGRTVAGTIEEAMTFGVIMPGGIALIADIETDNRNRILQDFNDAVRRKGGTIGSTAFYFSKLGKADFKPVETSQDLSLSQLLEDLLEYDGLVDIEELPGPTFRYWTEPSALMAVTKGVLENWPLDIVASDLVWAPKEDTMAEVGSSRSAEELDVLLSALRDIPEVKTIFANVRRGELGQDEWDSIQKNLDL